MDMLGSTPSLVSSALTPTEEMYRRENQVIAQRSARKRKPKIKREPASEMPMENAAPPPDQKLKTDTRVVEALMGGGKTGAALEQRYAKLATSKEAKRLPKTLLSDAPPSAGDPLTLTPLDRCTEEHEIGDMLINRETTQGQLGAVRQDAVLRQDHAFSASMKGLAFNPRSPVEHPPPMAHPEQAVRSGQTGMHNLTRRRRKKPKKLTEEKARRMYAGEERYEVQQGRQSETSEAAAERYQAISSEVQMDARVHERQETIDPDALPKDTLAKYKARNSDESYFLESLKEIDRREDSVVHKLPPPAVNHKLLFAMRDCLPFYDALVRYHVKANKPIPVPATYTWEYCETLLREAIPERGERPCRLAATGACESMQQFGFACRERMDEAEYRRFVNMRLTNPQMAKTALPMVQRLCLPCVLCHITHEYLKRLHKRQHKDDESQMPDGTSETYDDCEPICNLQMDVTTEGQYDIWACVGVGDAEYLGMPGPVVAWDPSNYVPETIELSNISRRDREFVERTKRIKRATTERRKREGTVPWDPGAWLRTAKAKKAQGFEEPVAVFRTPARTPVPGHFQSEMDPAPGQDHRQKRSVTIRVLRQRDENLRFRDGVMPVKVESAKSPRSTLTSCQ
jgi:hypothetical protein